MMDFREAGWRIIERAQEIDKRKFAAILVSLSIVGVAWHFGIIKPIASTIWDIAVGIWDMLSNLAAACGDFLQYVWDQRQT